MSIIFIDNARTVLELKLAKSVLWQSCLDLIGHLHSQLLRYSTYVRKIVIIDLFILVQIDFNFVF